MVVCEMCGKDTYLVDAMVESSVLKVCKDCSKFGHVMGKKQESVKKSQKVHFKKSKPQFVSRESEVIVRNYGARIRKAREKMGMKQEEVAKAIAERESVIQKVESGNLEPTLRLAKKFEQFLHITLVEEQKYEVEEKDEEEVNIRDGGLTIGDLLKFKK
jgi:putative transcription factor